MTADNPKSCDCASSKRFRFRHPESLLAALISTCAWNLRAAPISVEWIGPTSRQPEGVGRRYRTLRILKGNGSPILEEDAASLTT